jgi:glutamine amidotransferase
MITIIDYGLGNLGSISNMFKRIDVKCEITADPDVIDKAEKILLPGVGAFDAAMNRINERGLVEVLNKKALVDRVPFLGICLGMQLLTDKSEEGELQGLGYIKGVTRKFKFQDKVLKVPHMGWNIVNWKNSSLINLDMEQDEQRFYFVHSFYVKCENNDNVIGETEYGFKFDSVIQSDNVFGAQFHPEKSHRFGLKFFSNFSKI